MTLRNITLALLIVFALGGVVNQTADLNSSRPVARIVNRFAQWGLRWMLWYRIREPQAYETVGPNEIDHRSAL